MRKFLLALVPVLMFGVLLPVAASWGQPASAGRIPHPSAPAVAYDWCSYPFRHGDVCVQARGIAVVKGAWRTSAGHRLRAVRVPGRFQGQKQYQLHIAGRPGKCVGTNPGNTSGMVQPCGPGGTGTVVAIDGPVDGSFPVHIISRYWTQALGSSNHFRWLLSWTRHGGLLVWRRDGSVPTSQLWSPCSAQACGVTGTPAI